MAFPSHMAGCCLAPVALGRRLTVYLDCISAIYHVSHAVHKNLNLAVKRIRKIAILKLAQYGLINVLIIIGK